MAKPLSEAGGRGVLDSAFALLGAVESAEGAGVTRLAAACGLPKTTAHRLLEQLRDLGAVERSRGGYRIGARMFQLGQGWQPHPGLRKAVPDPMRRLVAATGATVAVSVLRSEQAVITDWLPGPGGSPVPLRRGGTWPWHTAMGKVMVAQAPETPLREPVPSSWPQEAARIRAQGVAFDREDVLPEVCCAAVPLYGPPGTPVASLCVITDPVHRLDRLAAAAQHAGRAISAALAKPLT